MVRDNALTEDPRRAKEIQEAQKAIERGIIQCLKVADVKGAKDHIHTAEVVLSYNTMTARSSIPKDLQEFISSQYGSRRVSARNIAVSTYHVYIDAWPMDDQHPYGERPGYIIVPDREIAVGDKLSLSLLKEVEGEFEGRMTFDVTELPLVTALSGKVRKPVPSRTQELNPYIVNVIAGMLPPELSKPAVWESWYSWKRWWPGTEPMEYINRHLAYPKREVRIAI